MAPIGPNGPGNPYNPGNNPYLPQPGRQIVPRSATQPLPALRATRPLRTAVARPAKAGGRGTKAGNADVELQTGDVQDIEGRIDQTNVFRMRSRNPSEDTVTISEYMAGYINRQRLQKLLRIWAANWCALFSWEAQAVKSYINFAFGKDKPQYVEARIYGYFSGGGF